MDYLVENNICDEDNLKPIAYRLNNELLKEAETLANGLTIFKKIKLNFDDFKNMPLYDLSSITDKEEKKRQMDIQREEIRKNYQKLQKNIEYYFGSVIAILNYKRFKEGLLDIETIEDYGYALSDNEQLES